MEDNVIQDFKNFVYKDLWTTISVAYQDLMKSFESDWQLYEDSEKEKLELIDLRIKETREHLVKSEFKIQFPLDVIKDNLSLELKNYCNTLPIYLTVDDLNYIDQDNLKNLFGFYYSKSDGVEFYRYTADLEYLLTLVQHISQYQFYIELKRRKAEILDKPAIDPQNELPEKSLKATSVEEENSEYICECQHIFKNPKARRIFEYLHNNLASKKNPTADYAFIFRRMQNDEYIYKDIKEKLFRDFLFDHFDIELNSKLKPDGYGFTDWREKIYMNAIRSTWWAGDPKSPAY